MITYKLFQGPAIKEAAQAALRARLYCYGWTLKLELEQLVDLHPHRYGSYRVVMAFDGDKPIGVLTCSRQHGLMAYVKSKHRRQGIGLSMMKFLGVMPINCHAGEGVKGTINFWLAAGLDRFAISRR